ncbi:MAG: alcohol dehydrogenase catalytic domain-containing protein [Chromatiales bacterium]|jgi:L-iditol 2-dehydrogenase|nr:alcohol dehydrogenase catalytic domain-containing protein [Chromatiales bacterium]
MKLPSTMAGAMLLGPGHIEVREVPLEPPQPGEIILKVEAATTCGTDVKVFRRGGHPRMLKVPTLFGHEMAGTVAALGEGVNRFSEGDRVVVANSAPCNACDYCARGRQNLCRSLQYLNGAFAEYVRVPRAFVDTNTYVIPARLGFARAALTEPLACVLHGIDACELLQRSTAGPVAVVVFGAGPIGLLFVAALARAGARVILADPNPNRLAVGARMGAADTIEIARGGGQAERIKARTDDGEGAEIVVDCTGIAEVWGDAIMSARTGGLVNLFGGCAPGTVVPLDTHHVHYQELTVKGVYHHRPDTIRRALALLGESDFPADELLNGRVAIEDVAEGLQAMMDKRALKVVVSGRREAPIAGCH